MHRACHLTLCHLSGRFGFFHLHVHKVTSICMGLLAPRLKVIAYSQHCCLHTQGCRYADGLNVHLHLHTTRPPAGLLFGQATPCSTLSCCRHNVLSKGPTIKAQPDSEALTASSCTAVTVKFAPRCTNQVEFLVAGAEQLVGLMETTALS